MRRVPPSHIAALATMVSVAQHLCKFPLVRKPLNMRAAPPPHLRAYACTFAVLTMADDDLKFAFGEERGGSWVDVERAAGGAPAAWAPSLASLVAGVHAAAEAGLVTLGLVPSAVAGPAAAAGAAAAAAAAAEPASGPAEAAGGDSAEGEACASPVLPEPPAAAPREAPAAVEAAAPPPAADAAAAASDDLDPSGRPKLPVTIISGFLGAGEDQAPVLARAVCAPVLPPMPVEL